MPPEEYAAIARRADDAGATMSEYVRDTVTAVHEQLPLREELSALRGLMIKRSPCEASHPRSEIAMQNPTRSFMDLDREIRTPAICYLRAYWP